MPSSRSPLEDFTTPFGPPKSRSAALVACACGAQSQSAPARTATVAISARPNSIRRSIVVLLCAVSGFEEFDEMIVDLVGRFLLQVVPGRKRLGVDEIARVFAPHRGE